MSPCSRGLLIASVALLVAQSASGADGAANQTDAIEVPDTLVNTATAVEREMFFGPLAVVGLKTMV